MEESKESEQQKDIDYNQKSENKIKQKKRRSDNK